MNALGQRTASTSSNPWQWDYDAKGQVVSAQRTGAPANSTVLQYDGIGNRKKSSSGSTLPGSDNYVTNAVNQYTSALSKAQTFDDDGNLTADSGCNEDSVPRQYEWDGESRLANVKVVSSGTVSAKMLYDAYGRRLAKVSGVATRFFLYDGWNLIADYSALGSGTPSLGRSHAWGPDLSGTLQGAGGVGGLLATRLSSTPAGIFYPCYDGNGNVVQYVTGGNAIQASYDLNLSGGPIALAGTTPDAFDIRFSTKFLDQETRCYYYGYRYYSPYQQRWLNRDPISESGGLNLYAFDGNDQVNGIDALGEKVRHTVDKENCTITFNLDIGLRVPGKYRKITKNGLQNTDYPEDKQNETKGKLKSIAQEIQKAIDKSWNKAGSACKPCKVIFKVSVNTNGEGDNIIDIVEDMDHRSYVEGVGGNRGTWKDTSMSSTYAHEAGHLMNLPDRYDYKTGIAESSMMGNQSNVTQNEIEELINNNKIKCPCEKK